MPSEKQPNLASASLAIYFYNLICISSKLFKNHEQALGDFFLKSKCILKSTGILLLWWRIQRIVPNCFHVGVNLEKELFIVSQKKR